MPTIGENMPSAWIRKIHQENGRGHTLLQALNLKRFNEELRTRLVHNKIAKGRLYSSHDFRRGHSKDLADKGSNIGQILGAGQWTSTAFMAYQNKEELETRAVKASHEVEDSDEDGSDD